jgi:hypothetical protein
VVLISISCRYALDNSQYFFFTLGARWNSNGMELTKEDLCLRGPHRIIYFLSYQLGIISII